MTVVLLPFRQGSSAFLSIVKILLRNKATGLFYAGGSQWTADAARARDFQTGLNAIQFSSRSPSDGLEFLYLQTDASEEFILPKMAIYNRARP